MLRKQKIAYTIWKKNWKENMDTQLARSFFQHLKYILDRQTLLSASINNIDKIHKKNRIRVTKFVRIPVPKVLLSYMASNPSTSRTPRQYTKNQDLGAARYWADLQCLVTWVSAELDILATCKASGTIPRHWNSTIQSRKLLKHCLLQFWQIITNFLPRTVHSRDISQKAVLMQPACFGVYENLLAPSMGHCVPVGLIVWECFWECLI